MFSNAALDSLDLQKNYSSKYFKKKASDSYVAELVNMWSLVDRH